MSLIYAALGGSKPGGGVTGVAFLDSLESMCLVAFRKCNPYAAFVSVSPNCCIVYSCGVGEVYNLPRNRVVLESFRLAFACK